MRSPSRPSGLHDPATEHSSCGVGLIVRKDGVQSHEVLAHAHRALCAVPHRGGMSAEGVGDGGGVSVDLSTRFFSQLTGRALERGRFGVGNFFLPADADRAGVAEKLVTRTLEAQGCTVMLVRDVPTDPSALRPAAVRVQLPIRQWVFTVPADADPERLTHRCLLDVEAVAYPDPELAGLYPLSLSTRTQVLKGRLNSWEVLRWFTDLRDPDHEVSGLYFHTRFSTNTDPHPTMAQPFRLLAHNGELNTDRKNRLADDALARARDRRIVRPPGQSDSARLDQTLHGRVVDDGLDLIAAIVAMMPPAWENDASLSEPVRAMLEYISLGEEKNDGPAALVFSDGDVIGARLDRLGLRPLRTCETDEYLTVSSEAGQFDLPADRVVRRGRIEAGGMLWWSRTERRSYDTEQTLELLAARADYPALLAAARTPLADCATGTAPPAPDDDLTLPQRYVAYGIDQEAFRFLLDPMLDSGSERISAMGYGNAINAFTDREGGVARFFTQRFAQVTNPPLDPIREADGMTLRVALGARPTGPADPGTHRIVLDSPVLTDDELSRLRGQDRIPVAEFALLHTPGELEPAITALCDDVVAFARDGGGIVVLDDRDLRTDRAAIPAVLAVAAVNRALIDAGRGPSVSLVVATGQVCSAHHLAVVLGFGASAVHPHAVLSRAAELHGSDPAAAFGRFRTAAEKSLLKTMGRVGLCTAESYIGGQFFEPAYLDTDDPVLRRWFPDLDSPVGGVGFTAIERSTMDWHARALTVTGADDIPQLGLFKERSDGAGHSYGVTAVRAFTGLTDEAVALTARPVEPSLRLLPLASLADAFGLHDEAYVHSGLRELTPAEIDAFTVTPGYREFVETLADERRRRPSALRDVLVPPVDLRDGPEVLDGIDAEGNASIAVRGLRIHDGRLTVGDPDALAAYLERRFGAEVTVERTGDTLVVDARGAAREWLDLLVGAPDPVELDMVAPAHEITRTLASGAMSHGALVAGAHEAVAHGTNMVGGMSNCGEGGEARSRFGTIRGSRIKQFASGRFGVWAGYLADPMIEQIEIKIAQGAKPGEGGQLPGPKVTVDIAAARGATPGVELVSPPPHHDTYSIEDLAQLIHDATAARVKVVVKLVSSEGIGTIAVGVAKAGAHVINVAGNTGGTGAAAVTSLKFAGRSAEVGVAEVHQALSAHGLRDAVELRCSGAHQTAGDVVTSALLGADGFEFGTTALMMLRCVMAKNCNVKCPAGITTNAEAFDGDPRALAQYLLNVAHEVREILARLGLRSLREARGRSDLLHLARHPAVVARLDLRRMLHRDTTEQVADPVRVGADHSHDEEWSAAVRVSLMDGRPGVEIEGGVLGNRHRSVGGRLSVDVERMLNHENVPGPALTDDRGRRFLPDGYARIRTRGAAGQSFGLLCNDGIRLEHTGTANDGVGKAACGGTIAVRSPGGGSSGPGGNVLVGNFALFGATGGRLFVEGEAGDRFAVRNSGATAVVEGVGDFGCEYMTGGAVLNLGTAGVGLGNGMSGGFLYQYDPQRRAEFSTDSVDVAPVGGFHETAVRLLLEWHLEATGSPVAGRLLSDWDTERAHVLVATPRALRLYQDADAILAARSRKELVDELAEALAAHQLRRHKLAARDGIPVARGAVPTDAGEEMFALLNGLTVQTIAEDVARRRGTSARNLLLTEDHAVRSRLVRYAREALAGYGDDELAVLVSDKRVGDLKAALARRDVYGTDSPGTFGWILAQDAANTERLGRIPGFEELFAAQAAPDLVGTP